MKPQYSEELSAQLVDLVECDNSTVLIDGTELDKK